MVSKSEYFRQNDQERSGPFKSEATRQVVYLEIRRHFSSNRAVEGWNLIPSVIKNASTVHFFKRAYRKLN
jgi:hypothetical protein